MMEGTAVAECAAIRLNALDAPVAGMCTSEAQNRPSATGYCRSRHDRVGCERSQGHKKTRAADSVCRVRV
jgi:hypothetical protein